MRIWEGIYSIEGRMGDCCIYVVDCGEEIALIDAGLGRDVGRLVKNIEREGLNMERLKKVFVTHCHIDHIGGLWNLKRRFGCKIIAHVLDSDPIEKGGRLTGVDLYGVPYTPVEVDIKVDTPQKRFDCGDIGLFCLHTPGHTPGSMSIYVDIGGKRVLFGGDIHGPFDPEWGSDIGEWRKSMKKLLELDADILCEGHFGVYSPREEVKKYIERYLEWI